MLAYILFIVPSSITMGGQERRGNAGLSGDEGEKGGGGGGENEYHRGHRLSTGRRHNGEEMERKKVLYRIYCE